MIYNLKLHSNEITVHSIFLNTYNILYSWTMTEIYVLSALGSRDHISVIALLSLLCISFIAQLIVL